MPEPLAAEETGLERAGEWLRRLALGLTAALIVARAGWPGETRGEVDSGQSLGWALAMLVAALTAILAAFFAGRVRLRFSWADLGVYLLIALVALSTRRAVEPRVAMNLAWEWAGVGLAYALLRHLPRGRREASTLAGILAATAVALAAFGLYQVAVIQPETRRIYLQNPEAALREAGVSTDAMARKRFEDRLLGSTEPTATFALANSLAGVLAGGAVLGLAAIASALGDGRRGRFAAIALAMPPLLIVLTCLVLTKSRSAYLGLLVGVAVLAWQARGLVPRRAAIGAILGGLALAAALVAGGFATGQLDLLVLTESTKSLRYRGEYWVGTWGVITESASRFWGGVGPGNFGGPYLQHKLPQASESISDPHNLFLEVWAVAGLPALLALAAGLGLGLREVFGRPEGEPVPEEAEPRAGWLVAAAGMGGVVLATLLRPELSPFAGDLMRWVVLGIGWLGAVVLGWALWSRGPIPAAGLGAAAVAVTVNLLAAGGIAFAPVALGLWGALALGQDLRPDRPCGRLRTAGGVGLTFGLAAAWAALAGTFVGTAWPSWRATAELARADEAIANARAAYTTAARALPPDLPVRDRADRAFERALPHYREAEAAFNRARAADRLANRVWIARAAYEHEVWRLKGEPIDAGNLVWHRIASALENPTNRDAIAIQSLRASYATDLLRRPGWPDFEVTVLRTALLDALLASVRLHPTESSLRVNLSDALHELGQEPEAAVQAGEALRLDARNPHADKALPDADRERMRTRAGG